VRGFRAAPVVAWKGNHGEPGGYLELLVLSSRVLGRNKMVLDIESTGRFGHPQETVEGVGVRKKRTAGQHMGGNWGGKLKKLSLCSREQRGQVKPNKKD